MIVYGEGLRPFIEEILHKFPEGTQFIGRVVNDEPVAVMAFHGWTGDDIELSLVAMPGSGTKGLLSIIFGYIFGQLGCARCTAKIREDNIDSRELVERLGFVQEGILRKAKDGKDVLIFGLLKEELHYGRRTFTPSRTRSQCDHKGAGASKPG